MVQSIFLKIQPFLEEFYETFTHLSATKHVRKLDIFQEMELKEQQMVNMCERERDLETQIQELGRKIKEYEGGTSDAAYINKLEA